jgi:hypothetical protein
VKKPAPTTSRKVRKMVDPTRELGRKAWRKRAERENNNRRCHWVGGRLYFFGTKDEVPGIPHIPKRDRKIAPGWEAGNTPKDIPQPSGRDDEFSRRRSSRIYNDRY